MVNANRWDFPSSLTILGAGVSAIDGAGAGKMVNRLSNGSSCSGGIESVPVMVMFSVGMGSLFIPRNYAQFGGKLQASVR